MSESIRKTSMLSEKDYLNSRWADGLIHFALNILYDDVFGISYSTRLIVVYDLLDQLQLRGFQRESDWVRDHLRQWEASIINHDHSFPKRAERAEGSLPSARAGESGERGEAY